MSNSTPYELRFKVLEMARDLCMDQYHQQTNAFWELHKKIECALDQPANAYAAAYADSLHAMIDQLIDAAPVMPSSEQINAKARELYEFVSTK